MHLQPTSRRSEGGSTLMTALFMCLVIMSVMASFLALVSSRYKITVRARSWNAALPMAEAGVEEALTHLQDDVNATDNGWTATTIGGQPVNVKQRNFTNGCYFYVTIYNSASSSPIIYSSGFSPTPLSTGNYLTRTVKVVTTKKTAGSGSAFNAIWWLEMFGSGAKGELGTDSFNSSDPKKSNSGMYHPKWASQNGSLGCVSGGVYVDSLMINGSIYLGSGAYSYVADAQVTGKTYSNQKLDYPDVVLPKANWLAAPIDKKNVHDFNLSGDYYINDNLPIVVEPGVKVRVRVDTQYYYPPSIDVLSTGVGDGCLTMYQVSGYMILTDSGKPRANKARNFAYYGLPDVWFIMFYPNSTVGANFCGTIYAPEAEFIGFDWNSGSDDFVGAITAGYIITWGPYKLHYDEDLGIAGSGSGGGSSSTVTVNSWQEL